MALFSLRRPARGARARPSPAAPATAEPEFLPAALELVETPASPAARWLLWGIIVFVVVALAWAVFGRIDIVAVAQGRVVPSGEVKVVQSLERAVVRRLRVRDGMQVAHGQLLIELDASELGAEQHKAGDSLADAALAVARARALLEAITSGATAARPIAAAPGLPEERREEANRLLAAEYLAFRQEQAARAAEARHLQAQRATAEAVLDKLLALQPLQEQRSADLQRLLARGYVTRHEVLEQENRRLEVASEISVQRRRLEEAALLQRQQQDAAAAAVAGVLRQVRAQGLQAEQQLAQWRQEAERLRGRGERLSLRAPVDGTVQQLAVHTEGGVVTEAQPLLVVVPAGESLEVDALLENRDVGFLRPGQEAEVKVEAFPFTRYGLLRGHVVRVSPDAVPDPQRGPLYQVRVGLERDWMTIDGRRVGLAPGMAVSVEVKTGSRRVIDYFLGPLAEYGQATLRER